MINELIRIVEENPAVTLDEMATQLRSRLPQKPQIGKTTVARALEGQMYTLKLMEDVPEQRNAPQMIEDRQEYARWMLDEGLRIGIKQKLKPNPMIV